MEKEESLEVRVAVLETHFKHISQQFGTLETKLDGVKNIIWGAMVTLILGMTAITGFFVKEKNDVVMTMKSQTERIINAAEKINDASQ